MKEVKAPAPILVAALGCISAAMSRVDREAGGRRFLTAVVETSSAG
jgi:hypothetical protein